jgi:hypothetical protein
MTRGILALALVLATAGPGLAFTYDQSIGTPPGNGDTVLTPFPAPNVPDNAPIPAFLTAARAAIAAGRIGEAMEALERAESRALSRSMAPSAIYTPSSDVVVQGIADARLKLAAGDRAGADRVLGELLGRYGTSQD